MFDNLEQSMTHVRAQPRSIPFIVNTVYASVDEDFDHLDDNEEIVSQDGRFNHLFEASHAF